MIKKKEPKRFKTSYGYTAFKEKGSDGKIHVILEHRRIMENHLGRKLWPIEVVHHKNGDTSDNRVENLEITARGKHSSGHSKNHIWRRLDRLVYEKPRNT